jgi:hypothetical protein
MRSEEYTTLLAALGDIQTAVDATALDVERVLEIVAWTDADSPLPPEWVNPADEAAEDATGATEEVYPAVAYPPPARGNVGAVAGYVVIAALAAVVVAVLVLLYLLGGR